MLVATPWRAGPQGRPGVHSPVDELRCQELPCRLDRRSQISHEFLQWPRGSPGRSEAGARGVWFVFSSSGLGPGSTHAWPLGVISSRSPSERSGPCSIFLEGVRLSGTGLPPSTMQGGGEQVLSIPSSVFPVFRRNTPAPVPLWPSSALRSLDVEEQARMRCMLRNQRNRALARFFSL